ncbi:hypothetical protein H4R33_004070, partial [Dimargaris cristalligena]
AVDIIPEVYSVLDILSSEAKTNEYFGRILPLIDTLIRPCFFEVYLYGPLQALGYPHFGKPMEGRLVHPPAVASNPELKKAVESLHNELQSSGNMDFTMSVTNEGERNLFTSTFWPLETMARKNMLKQIVQLIKILQSETFVDAFDRQLPPWVPERFLQLSQLVDRTLTTVSQRNSASNRMVEFNGANRLKDIQAWFESTITEHTLFTLARADSKTPETLIKALAELGGLSNHLAEYSFYSLRVAVAYGAQSNQDNLAAAIMRDPATLERICSCPMEGGLKNLQATLCRGNPNLPPQKAQCEYFSMVGGLALDLNVNGQLIHRYYHAMPDSVRNQAYPPSANSY